MQLPALGRCGFQNDAAAARGRRTSRNAPQRRRAQNRLPADHPALRARHHNRERGASHSASPSSFMAPHGLESCFYRPAAVVKRGFHESGGQLHKPEGFLAAPLRILRQVYVRQQDASNMAKMSTPAIPRFCTRFACVFARAIEFVSNFRQNAARTDATRAYASLWTAESQVGSPTKALERLRQPPTPQPKHHASHHSPSALLQPPQALQINHIFRRPTPFLNEKNTFTEDDGYKLLEGHREKRFTVAWARDLLRPPKPGKLVLVRHGESTWNRNATFTGWTDVDLSERGEREVEHASRLLLEAGISVDVCYTSRLRRAIRSSWILLKGLDAVYRPVFKSWRLNQCP